MRRTFAALLFCWVPWWIGCGASPGEIQPSADAGSDVEDGAFVDVFGPSPTDAASLDAAPLCPTNADDYTPRLMMSATDAWPACNADDGLYRTLGTGSSALVSDFERVFSPPYFPDPFGGPTSPFAQGQLSSWPRRNPTATDFNSARWHFSAYGLERQLQRQHDDHLSRPEGTCPGIPEAPCACEDFAARNPAYCLGGGGLRRVVIDGINSGRSPDSALPSRIYAARIEAAFLWFFYLAAYAEAGACTTAPARCDGAITLYSGVFTRDRGRGLARYIQEVDAEAHDRIFDALLALRCWRDLDRMTPSTMSELHARARHQLDRALRRGMVVLLLDRLGRFDLAAGSEKQAYWAFLQTWLAPLPAWTYTQGDTRIEVPERPSLFDGLLRPLDPSAADFVAREAARPMGEVDTVALALRINRALACD